LNENNLGENRSEVSCAPVFCGVDLALVAGRQYYSQHQINKAGGSQHDYRCHRAAPAIAFKQNQRQEHRGF